MNPSRNDNSFDSFGLGGATPMMATLKTSSDGGDLRSKKLKKRVFLFVIISIVTVIVVLAIVLVTFFSSRQNFKEKAEELYSILGWVSRTSQCSLVSNNVENIYTTISEYQGYLDKCKDDTLKINDLMKELEKADNSTEYASLYQNLEGYIAKNIVSGENLDRLLAIYDAWHKYVLNMKDMNYYQIDEEVDGIVAPLIETQDDGLVKYAEEWTERKKDLNLTYAMAQGGGSEYRDEFERKLSDFENFMRSSSMGLFGTRGFDSEEDDIDFKKALILFKNYIEEEI